MEKLISLDLTLAVGCKLNCDYCPQDLLIHKYYKENPKRRQKLKFEDFKTVLDKVEVGSTIGFAGMSEPFLNEECADMIAYAYKKGYKISLYTTLVGMSLEDCEKIKDVEFDRCVLHIPDKEYKSKFQITDEYLEALKAFQQNFRVDFYSCHGTVHPAIENLIDKKRNFGIDAQDRAGNIEIEGFGRLNRKGRIVCYRAWSSSAMNLSFTPELFPDGTLLLCCQDYGMKHPLGNLIYQTWEEIQEGSEYKKFLKGLNDDSIDILCRKCICAKTVDELPPFQFKKAVSKAKNGYNYEGILSEDAFEIVNRFAMADTVCVFGLGKLFEEHFFQEFWNEGLNVSILSDNNSKLHNTYINNIPCILPENLVKYKNLIVVLFVKNNIQDIITQLESIGINNYILIDEVLDKVNLLSEEINTLVNTGKYNR